MYIKDKVTIKVQSAVMGPGGVKLIVGSHVALDDAPYVRILLKSGTVALVDPPSLDPEYLEKAGYELKEGYSYPAKVVEPEKAEEAPVVKVVTEAPVVKAAEAPVVEAPKADSGYLTRKPVVPAKISEKLVKDDSEE